MKTLEENKAIHEEFNEDEIQRLLGGLQFGRYETEVYLALIKHGPQNYRGLTRLSGVPYGRIYSVLKSLKSKGWIKAVDGRPRIFQAIDPQVPLMQKWRLVSKRFRGLEEEFQRITPQLEMLYNQSHNVKELLVREERR